MLKLRTDDRAAAINHPGRCFGCFRPHRDCFCAAIPSVENQTEVLILQHRREWLHPFNTARIAHRALQNSTLLIDHTAGLAARLELKPHAGLLYPGPGATLLADLPADQRPEQLVVVDGTWHHTRTMTRDISALHRLPRYRLAPAEPSRYRIRREPDAMCLSTVEAVVAALHSLEPETRGLDLLLKAFDGMVERQLAHPKAERGWRRNSARTGCGLNIPAAILGDLGHVVVAYGESTSVERGSQREDPMPLSWTAQRLGTGERFACTIRPPVPLPDAVLGHLELAPKDFHQALSLDEARRTWSQFQQPSDQLVVYNHSTARLLAQITEQFAPCLVLKSVEFNPLRHYSTLDEIVAGEGLSIGPTLHPGRAGRRLASVVALIEHLRGLGRTPVNS